MRPAFLRIAFFLALSLGAASASFTAGAAGLSELEAGAVRQVIVAQLQAFADDDADSAFAFASPGIRAAIGEAGHFLAMVRGAYPMVYRPAAFSFLKPEEDSGEVMQLVQITDDHDKSWLVLFSLERQPDASWRISGCAVAENRWRSA